MKQNLKLQHPLDLKSFFEKRGLEPTHMARILGPELFPKVKFPDKALQRIINGHGELTANQASAIAERFGCDISELFSDKPYTPEETKKEEDDDLL